MYRNLFVILVFIGMLLVVINAYVVTPAPSNVVWQSHEAYETWRLEWLKSLDNPGPGHSNRDINVGDTPHMEKRDMHRNLMHRNLFIGVTAAMLLSGATRMVLDNGYSAQERTYKLACDAILNKYPVSGRTVFPELGNQRVGVAWGCVITSVNNIGWFVQLDYFDDQPHVVDCKRMHLLLNNSYYRQCNNYR